MLHITDLHHTIKDRKLFNGLTLSLSPGDKRLILGPSGRGKTTLFKLIMGFAAPGKGSIVINGMDMERHGVQTVRRQLFYLSQDIDFPDMITQSLLDQVYQANGIEDHQAHRPWMERLALPGALLEYPVSDLSGGERQRLGLLICFLLNRPIWLLDEPTSALDDAMKEIIHHQITTSPATVLMISHDRIWQESSHIQIERWN